MNDQAKAVTIGQTIRALRGLRKMGLNELAEESGVSQGFLSQMENGKNDNPSMETLRKIAKALGFKLSVEFVL